MPRNPIAIRLNRNDFRRLVSGRVVTGLSYDDTGSPWEVSLDLDDGGGELSQRDPPEAAELVFTRPHSKPRRRRKE